MKNVRKASMQFFLALALVAAPLVAFQLQETEALAQSSYFSNRGCTNCHSTPVASTCAGCHEHSGALTATKNKTTPYAPGETVTITLTSSGARSGWIGVRLYNQTGAEIARSTGNQSGEGGSAVYPAVLSAPAPATAGTYTWRIAYLGNENGEGGGDVHSEISVNFSFTVASAADTTVPVVTFTLPATATSLTVPVTTFTATDNVGVTGYLINKSATAPTTGWLTAAPASVTAVAGSNTFYAWARDAAGNVSLAKSASVTVTIPPPVDTTAPVVSFTLPATSTSLTVPVTTFTATDNVGVTGYLITTSATAPTSGWLASAPASVTAVAGSNTFYAWARDAAGNISASVSATVTAAPAAQVTSKVRVYRNGSWFRDTNGNGVWDSSIDVINNFGILEDIPVSGDWNNTGTEQIGVFRNGQWYLDLNGNGAWDAGTDVIYNFGIPGDIPVTGDWNNTGTTKLGVFRNGQWYLDMNGNGTWDAGTDVIYNFGIPGDIPVTGDWNNTGTTKLGVFRNDQWYLDMNGNGAWNAGTDAIYNFGIPGDIPVTGDWAGTGTSSIGVFRNGQWYLDKNGNGAWDAGTDVLNNFGIFGDTPIVGKW